MMRSTLIYIFIAFFSITTLFGQNETEEDSCQLKINNVVSTGSSGKLIASCNCEVIGFTYTLYTRWGEIVYKTSEFTTPLDFDINKTVQKGKVNTLVYPAGVYYFIAEFKYKYGLEEKSKSLKGTLTVIR